MSSPAVSNPNIPQIPSPLANVGSLANVAQALKQGMDVLAGNRGNTPLNARAVTINDLITLGLISPQLLVIQPTDPLVIQGFNTAAPMLANYSAYYAQMPCVVAFPANFGPPNIKLYSGIAALITATSSSVMQIMKCPAASNPLVGTNFAQVGIATFTPGAAAAALSSTGGVEVTFAQGDWLMLRAAATPDATLGYISVTLIGNRA